MDPRNALLYAIASAAKTVDGNSGDIDVRALDAIDVDINLTALTGVVTFWWDRKGNDGIYYPIWGPSSRVNTGVLSRSIGPGREINRSLGPTGRLRWSPNGTGKSATFSASIVGVNGPDLVSRGVPQQVNDCAVIRQESAAQDAGFTLATMDLTPFKTLAIDINLTAVGGSSSPSVQFFYDRLGADGVWYPVWSPAKSAVAAVISTTIGVGQATNADIGQAGRLRMIGVDGSAQTGTFTASIIAR